MHTLFLLPGEQVRRQTSAAAAFRRDAVISFIIFQLSFGFASAGEAQIQPPAAEVG